MPDAPTATKTRLLDTATELFAEHGFRSTSMRQITAAADANLAAVHYHFGSKEELLRAVLERELVPLNRARLARLDRVESECAEPRLRAILEAFLQPALRLGERPGGRRFLQLLGRVHSEPERTPVKELFFEQFGEITARFLPLLQRELPQLTPPELHWRVHFLIGSMAHTMMCADGITFLSGGTCDPHDVDRALEELVTFAEAGLLAATRTP